MALSLPRRNFLILRRRLIQPHNRSMMLAFGVPCGGTAALAASGAEPGENQRNPAVATAEGLAIAAAAMAIRNLAKGAAINAFKQPAAMRAPLI